MKRKIKKMLLCAMLLLGVSLNAQENYVTIQTKNTSLILHAEKGNTPYFIYYGEKNNIDDIENSSTGIWYDAIPAFGTSAWNEPIMQVIHADGDATLKFQVENVEQYTSGEIQSTIITLKDKAYPFYVKMYYKAYESSDIIEAWTEIYHKEKKAVVLQKFASVYLPIRPGEHWLTHYHGFQVNEMNIYEEPLTSGTKMIKNRDGLRNTQRDSPSFMVTLDQKPTEDTGNVIGGTLVWSGNYRLLFDTNYMHMLNISVGINEDASQYNLAAGEVFRTPAVALTYSTQGKGQVSRNYHKWARKYMVTKGEETRDILLNSWEGVYFDVNQDVMDEMMREFSNLGGELFVMDDGWFGNKYARNDGSTGLGDWQVCEKKLPQGIDGLIEAAKKNNIKFGIWIEPEMTNTKSELYEKHPNWVLRSKNREPQCGRGGTQLVLDLTNPKVQDFVFGVVDNLLTKNPQIAYIKWDANMALENYGSPYLPANKQTHIYIEYHRGLNNVLERIRTKYPDVVMQVCAAGGGRANYGLMPYFNECWTSDDTDALQRLYIQWGYSNFFPANTMAAHVSASPNHQSGRVVPIKFRFDVAMAGRLGMEMHPKTLTEEEKEFSKSAIETYKSIREIVQLGDLYRLISPYENRRTASLMYVNDEKDHAVFFAYQMEHLLRQAVVRYKMNGLDPQKQYILTEINKDINSKRTFKSEDKIISGEYLMKEGINLPLNREFTSIVIELKEVK